MDNLGAFITLNGNDLKPNFTTYEAVVSIISQFLPKANLFLCYAPLSHAAETEIEFSTFASETEPSTLDFIADN